VEGVTAKGVSAIPHKEGMAFDARAIEPMQKLIFQLACAVAESERTLSSECQKEDIAAARVKGKVLGRPRRRYGKLLAALKHCLNRQAQVQPQKQDRRGYWNRGDRFCHWQARPGNQLRTRHISSDCQIKSDPL